MKYTCIAYDILMETFGGMQDGYTQNLTEKDKETVQLPRYGKMWVVRCLRCYMSLDQP